MSSSDTNFKQNYQRHLKHLKLKGLQPKTIEAYSRAIRRIGAYFEYQITALSKQQLTDYFTDLLDSHSWSAVKLDLYGLKFYSTHVLHKPWENINLIKPPKTQRLPDIVTIEEAKRLFMATHTLSYRVFYFTAYSLGLRLGEGLRLEVGDMDARRHRVLIRHSVVVGIAVVEQRADQKFMRVAQPVAVTVGLRLWSAVYPELRSKRGRMRPLCRTVRPPTPDCRCRFCGPW